VKDLTNAQNVARLSHDPTIANGIRSYTSEGGKSLAKVLERSHSYDTGSS
jgi:hypothetical protein